VIGWSLEFYADFVLGLRKVWIGVYFHSQLFARVIVIWAGVYRGGYFGGFAAFLGYTVFCFVFCSVL
jgi:hypothetical protein